MTKKIKTKPEVEPPYLKIKGLSPTLKMQLKNISKHLGITLTAMLKPKLREIADSYPEKMKQPYVE